METKNTICKEEIYLGSDLVIKSNQKDVISYLCCQICTGIVTNPVECSSCDKCFCSGCITKWLIQKDICPHCRGGFVKRNLHRSLLDILNNLFLKCPKNECDYENYYEQVMNHLRHECNYMQIQCPYGCEEVFER